MGLGTVYSKNPDFIQRDVAGECILVPLHRIAPDQNNIYVLNETGAALWHRINGRQSASAIADSFSQEYDVSLDRLHQDLETLLADLLSIHAIEEVSVDNGPTT